MFRDGRAAPALRFKARLAGLCALGVLAVGSWGCSPPRGLEPARAASIRVVYVMHGGAVNGRTVADTIREEAAIARATHARLCYVMEWPAPFATWEAWQAADPVIAAESKEAFLKLAPESAAAQGREVEARGLLAAWVRWRDAAARNVRMTRSIGRGDPAFGAEIDRALADVGDTLTDIYIEGTYPVEGLSPPEREGRDRQLFVAWSAAYRHYLYAQLCENNEILRALDEGDPGRFHAQVRAGLRVHRESLRHRNEVMASTLRWIAATGSTERPVRVVLFFGLAHAFTPTLKAALGDALAETEIPSTCGRYDDVLQIYRDLDGFEQRGDGADPDRHALSTQITSPEESFDAASVRTRDDLLEALTPADIDAVIVAMKGIQQQPHLVRFERLRRALGEHLLAAHPEPEAQGRAQRYLSMIAGPPASQPASAPAPR